MKYPIVAALTAIVLGGLIHIAVVLAMPMLAERSGWAQVAQLGAPNEMLVLPAATPKAISFPLMAPDVRYAVCRYDLDDGPVKIDMPVGDDLWLIAFYTPDGNNFYTISGGDIRREQIRILIATATQGVGDPSSEGEAKGSMAGDDLVIVRPPDPKGIALIRAPLRGAIYGKQVEKALATASCGRMDTSAFESSGPPLPTMAPDDRGR